MSIQHMTTTHKDMAGLVSDALKTAEENYGDQMYLDSPSDDLSLDQLNEDMVLNELENNLE